MNAQVYVGREGRLVRLTTRAAPPGYVGPVVSLSLDESDLDELIERLMAVRAEIGLPTLCGACGQVMTPRAREFFAGGEPPLLDALEQPSE